MYYLRTRPAAQAIQFTVDQALLKDVKMKEKPTSAVPPKAKAETGILTPTSSSESSPTRPVAISSSSVAASAVSLEDRTKQAAEADPEFAAALQRQKDRELEGAWLEDRMKQADPDFAAALRLHLCTSYNTCTVSPILQSQVKLSL